MRTLHAFSTSVGTKLLIALTGLALVGFLIFHLAGNLLLFFGPDGLQRARARPDLQPAGDSG